MGAGYFLSYKYTKMLPSYEFSKRIFRDVCMVTGLVSLKYCNRISCTQTRVQVVGEDFLLFVVSLREFRSVSQMKIFKTAQNRDSTVCNCRHSKPSAPVSSKYCVI